QLTGSTVTVNSTGVLDASGALVAANDIQLLSLGGAAGGTFTLTFAGQTTSSLAFNATAAQIQTALQNLSSIGSGNVTVTRLTTGLFGITFTGALANANMNMLVLNSSLTGATFPTISSITHGAGTNNTNEVQFISLGGATGGTFTLTFNGQTTAAIPAND